MANLYEKVITELSFYNNNNNQVSDPIIVPYDLLQDYQAQTKAIY
ncbi:32293_t:CDS:1, partial [Gigaspora margarita]